MTCKELETLKVFLRHAGFFFVRHQSFTTSFLLSTLYFFCTNSDIHFLSPLDTRLPSTSSINRFTSMPYLFPTFLITIVVFSFLKFVCSVLLLSVPPLFRYFRGHAVKWFIY